MKTMPIGTDRRAYTLQRLREALQRVLNGTAKHVRPGYRIGVSSVCAEAGLSRTAVYKRYPEIVAEIESAATENARPKVPRSRRRELEVRGENRELHRRIESLLSQNAMLVYRSVEAEKRAEVRMSKNVIPMDAVLRRNTTAAH